MLNRRFFAVGVWAVALVFCTLLASPVSWLPEPPLARADEDDAPDEPPPPPDETESEDEDEKEADEPSAAAPPTLHKIYVPYRELGKVFESEGEGVFMPYEEFLALWRRAHGTEGPDDAPPVGATVRSAAYEGDVQGDLVHLEATLQVETLAPGWHRIPIDFTGAGIAAATLDGAPAVLVPAESGYTLVTRGKALRTLVLSLRVPVTRDGDRHGAALHVPPVPLARLTLRVPGAATEVDVQPRLAATTRPSADGRTELSAFLGAVDKLQITWRQRVDEGPRITPLVFADETHDVRVDRGVVRSEMTADVSVLRAPLESVTLRVPADAVTLYVQGEGIRTWSRSDDGTRIDVELRESVRERWRLSVGLERPLGDLPLEAVLPLAALEDVERETGTLRLLAGDGVQVEPLETGGMLQIDVVELPEALRNAPTGRATAYRFPSRPGPVTVRVEGLEPRISAVIGNRIVIRPEGVDVRTATRVVVERAGVFGVSFDLPPDIEVTAVRVSGTDYDDHAVREVEGRRTLDVTFRDRLLGTAEIQVDGRRATPLPAEDADPDEESSLSVPILKLRGADHVHGFVVIQVDPSLEERETLREGLTPLDAVTPAAIEPPTVAGARAPIVQRLEHHEGELVLDVALKRREPVVTAQVESTVRLEPDRTRVGVVLRYDVRYRGIDTMRFTAPRGLAGKIHTALDGAQLFGPEDVESPAGALRGLWTLKLPGERTGAVPLVLEIDDLVFDEALETGTSLEVDVPTFVPVQQDGTPLPNTVHHVAVRRDPLLEVAPLPLVGAEEIDARELPPGLASDDNFLAFRAYDPAYALSLVVVRHVYEDPAEVVITHMHLDTEVGGRGRAATDAYLVVRNNDRQVLELSLPGDAVIRALTVDGKSHNPLEGEDGGILVPLRVGLGKDESFVVALSFDHEIERSSALFYETTTLQSPVATDVVADLLTWRVFVPEDRVYTSFDGSVELVNPPRSWVARLVSNLFRTLGRTGPDGGVVVRRQIERFHSPFATAHEGRAYLFSNRTGTGTIEVTSASPGAFTFWKVLWFAIAFAGMGLLLTFAGRRQIAGFAFSLVLVLLLLLLIPAAPGTSQVLNAMVYGVVVAGGLYLLRRALASRAGHAPPSKAEGSPDDGGPEPVLEGGAS